MILFINSCQPERIFIGLQKNDIFLKKNYPCSDFFKSEKLLVYLDGFLKEHRVKLSDSKGMVVVSGPGSFTSVRLGVVVANALGFSLNIPVVGVKTTEFKATEGLISLGVDKLKKAKKGAIVSPFYGKPPNITKAKSRV